MKVTIELTPEEIEIVKKTREVASKSMAQEDSDFCPGDGGNFDDTYSLGQDDGEILMARQVRGIFDKLALVIITQQ